MGEGSTPLTAALFGDQLYYFFRFPLAIIPSILETEPKKNNTNREASGLPGVRTDQEPVCPLHKCFGDTVQAWLSSSLRQEGHRVGTRPQG